MGSDRGGCGSGCGRRTRARAADTRPGRARPAPPRIRPLALRGLPLVVRSEPCLQSRPAPFRLVKWPARQGRWRAGLPGAEGAEGGAGLVGPRGPRPWELLPLAREEVIGAGAEGPGRQLLGEARDSPGNRAGPGEMETVLGSESATGCGLGRGRRSPARDSAPGSSALNGAHSRVHALRGLPGAAQPTEGPGTGNSPQEGAARRVGTMGAPQDLAEKAEGRAGSLRSSVARPSCTPFPAGGSGMAASCLPGRLVASAGPGGRAGAGSAGAPGLSGGHLSRGRTSRAPSFCPVSTGLLFLT